MPLAKDPQGGGTNADGTRSRMYCSKCFQHGQFAHPDIDTSEKMQVFAKGKLTEMGFPGFLAWFFTRGIPKLERWRRK